MDDMIFAVTSKNTVAAKAQLKLFLFLHEKGIGQKYQPKQINFGKFSYAEKARVANQEQLVFIRLFIRSLITRKR